MAFVNDNYCNLKDSYLFSQIAQKVNAYVAEHPEKKVIRMGIGDVTPAFGAGRYRRDAESRCRNGRKGNFPWLRTGAGL